MNLYQAAAHDFHPFGFNVTAIERGAKKPLGEWKVWERRRQTLDDVNAMPWLQAAGVGIVSGIGGYHGFDFDKCPDFGPVATVLQTLELPAAYPWVWRSGSGNGWGLAVLCFDDIPTGILATNGRGPGVYKAAGVGFEHLELRWERCQTVLPPSQHPTGPGYCWRTEAPTDRPATVTAAQIVAAFQAVTLRPPGRSTPAPSAPAPVMRPAGNGYGAAARRNELDTLSRATEGGRNDALNRAAFALGQLVGGGELDRGDVANDLLAVALSIGLGENEAVNTIASGLTSGMNEPRTAPAPKTPHTYTTPDEPGWLAEIADLGAVDAPEPVCLPDDNLAERLHSTPTTPARPTVKTSWTVAELLSTDFPEPPWAVPGIVPVGLSVLAGRPKVGKSWLGLQIAHAVGTGGMALNQRVTAGKVLYLALEDGPRRLKGRLLTERPQLCQRDVSHCLATVHRRRA